MCQYRSVVWVGDIVQVVRWAMHGGATSHPGVYNMGGPERLTRVDVAKAVAKHLAVGADDTGSSNGGGGGGSSATVESALPPFVKGVPKSSFPDMGVASPSDISMDSSAISKVSGVALTPLSAMADLYGGGGGAPQANVEALSANHRSALSSKPAFAAVAKLMAGGGGGGLTLIVQLGAANDASGAVDADVLARCRRTKELLSIHGENARVLASGGSDPAFPFNPTATEHWRLVEGSLLAAGVREQALLRPGLPALHTVHEAIMAHERIRQCDARVVDSSLSHSPAIYMTCPPHQPCHGRLCRQPIAQSLSAATARVASPPPPARAGTSSVAGHRTSSSESSCSLPTTTSPACATSSRSLSGRMHTSTSHCMSRPSPVPCKALSSKHAVPTRPPRSKPSRPRRMVSGSSGSAPRASRASTARDEPEANEAAAIWRSGVWRLIRPCQWIRCWLPIGSEMRPCWMLGRRPQAVARSIVHRASSSGAVVTRQHLRPGSGLGLRFMGGGVFRYG